MRVLCIGGGPAGLYLALLLKKANPDNVVRVLERNRPYDTFGWGVVFSDQTLGNLSAADPQTAREIADAFNHWDDIDVHFKGRTITSGGHGFCGIGRKRLLNILQARCEALGVELVFEEDITDDVAAVRAFAADVVIAGDGLNSRIRTRYAGTFAPDVDVRRCRFVWLGTKQRFPAFTFAFAHTPHGWFQAHAYQYDGDTSTFIVETPEETWRAAGLEAMSQEEGIAFCERLFAQYLGGHALMSNATHLRGSAIWIRFPRVVCRKWVHWNEIDGRQVPVILVGDAAHTAHFSVGSGTKLALEDAIALAGALSDPDDLRAAFWIFSTSTPRSASYAASAAGRAWRSDSAPASAMASSSASLVPDPMEKCAVCAASPTRMTGILFPSISFQCTHFRQTTRGNRIQMAEPRRWAALLISA